MRPSARARATPSSDHGQSLVHAAGVGQGHAEVGGQGRVEQRGARAGGQAALEDGDGVLEAALADEHAAQAEVRVGERVRVLRGLRDLHAFLGGGHRVREVSQLGQAPHQMAARQDGGEPVLAEVLIGQIGSRAWR